MTKTSSGASDPALGSLTEEQILAAGRRAPSLFIEAAPGSGKTPVAAQRFGAHRYRLTPSPSGDVDVRGVHAVSFTRSATWELHRRVRTTWGPSAISEPHRITTLDTLVCDLLTHLLVEATITWPGGHRSLEVFDTWEVVVRHAWMRRTARVVLDGREVKLGLGFAAKANIRPEPEPLAQAIAEGKCTHEDVRSILSAALEDPDIAAAVSERLALTTRSLVVDEVFDANDLDIALIALALDAGVEVTLVGDPCQALYGFRGARADLVAGLLESSGMTVSKLTESFRWRTDNQAELARALRAGEGVLLDEGSFDLPIAEQADVLLACVCKDLWASSTAVLPLAWQAARGNEMEAATTLLLNQLVSVTFGLRGTYLGEALATLGITDVEAVERMEGMFVDVLDSLRGASTCTALNSVYDDMIAAVSTESERSFKPAHTAYTGRLKALRARLVAGAQLVPGMTIHQAKGREWNRVALRLTNEEVHLLAQGLAHDNERHRQLYVACTRARSRTLRL